ncbi:MAG: trimeric autotransporter adhesin [Frankiaceae bacterium]|jgi:sugar lactone lactonase YvrE|nr:trimeric autotransporter adhesin [Frankiaceae bacterium]
MAGNAYRLTLLAVAVAAAAVVPGATAVPQAIGEATIDTVAGGLSTRIPADQLPLATTDLVVDPAGRVYVASMAGPGAVVFRIDLDGYATRVAGVVGSGPLGDGGPATRATLKSASAITLDAAGNLYVADSYRVRRITPGGVISTVAGTGVPGGLGDGGPATAAQIYLPTGLAVDAAGAMYIAEASEHRIRKVSPTGVISTYVGVGLTADGSATTGADPATGATLRAPRALTVDRDGSLYVVGDATRSVYKVGTDGRVTPSAGLGSPAGDLPTAVTGIAATLGGGPTAANAWQYTGDGGPASLAAFGNPNGVAVDASGAVYVADGMVASNASNWVGKLRVRKVVGSTVSTVAGDGKVGYRGEGGPATAASLEAVTGVAVGPHGDLYVADGSRVLTVSAATGVVTTAAGMRAGSFGDGLLATAVMVSNPRSLTSAAGTFYFIDSVAGSADIVRRVRSGRVDTVVGGGTEALADGVAARGARFDNNVGIGIVGIAVDTAGTLYVASQAGGRGLVWKVTADGSLALFAGVVGDGRDQTDGRRATETYFDSIVAIAADPRGGLFVAVPQQVRRVATDGIVRTVAGMVPAPSALGDGGPATAAHVEPAALAVAPAGDLYIVEYNTNRIRRVAPDGIITTFAGSGKNGYGGDEGPAPDAALRAPAGAAADASGQVYVADYGNHRIRRIDASGRITTVAGSGATGFAGDGGAAADAAVDSPSSVVALPDGRVVFADGPRVRAIVPPAKASLTLTAAPARVRAGGTVVVGGVLRVAGRPAAGLVVELSRRAATAGTYAVFARVRTDSGGRFRATDRPRLDQVYVASYAGGVGILSAISAPVTVRVTAGDG